MFEKNHATEGLVAAAIVVLAEYGPGDVVPHFELARAVGCAPPEPRYYDLVRRARDRHMASSGRWTREVPGVGYRFLTPDQQLTEEQTDRRRRMRRQSNIGMKTAASLPESGLTDHQRRLKQHVVESHAKLRREILAEERHEKWLLRPAADKPIRLAK